MQSERMTFDEYYLNLANAVSKRAACTRRKVGAVLTLNNRVVATGYNGAPAGQPECTDGACPRGTRSDAEVASLSPYTGSGACIAYHAEVNALNWVVGQYMNWFQWSKLTMYVNYRPCETCWNILEESVGRIVYQSTKYGGDRPDYHVFEASLGYPAWSTTPW